MKKKILITGPVLSASGYGKMARFAVEALRRHEDEYELYVSATPWGQTGWLLDRTEEVEWLQSARLRTQEYVNNKGTFDISLQISIPNEWKPIAPVNIGYTAGIETTAISPAWLEPSNMMDKIITISEFSKNIFVNTSFKNNSGQTFKVSTDIDVVQFPFPAAEQEEINLELENDFNFLCVNQWGARKNIELLITSFVNEFRNENVGLVLKLNNVNDSNIDKASVEKNLKNLIDGLGPKNCKIHLIHGRLTDKQMSYVFNHPKIKSFVTATHGEGFGFPIFEAAAAELPVVATDWSAHLEFLTMPDEQGKDKKMFAKVDYQLARIEKAHVWPGVMEEQSGWAFPVQSSLAGKMREVYKDYPRFKSWAKKLAAYNKVQYSKEEILEKFVNSIKV